MFYPSSGSDSEGEGGDAAKSAARSEQEKHEEDLLLERPDRHAEEEWTVVSPLNVPEASDAAAASAAPSSARERARQKALEKERRRRERSGPQTLEGKAVTVKSVARRESEDGGRRRHTRRHRRGKKDSGSDEGSSSGDEDSGSLSAETLPAADRTKKRVVIRRKNRDSGGARELTETESRLAKSGISTSYSPSSKKERDRDRGSRHSSKHHSSSSSSRTSSSGRHGKSSSTAAAAAAAAAAAPTSGRDRSDSGSLSSSSESEISSSGSVSAGVCDSGVLVGGRSVPRSPPRPQLDLSDIYSFLFKPATEGAMIECVIERDKGKDKMHPMFYLYLEENHKFLLAARKRKKSKTSNYLISLDKSDTSRRSGNYVGKVRSNFFGTEFVLYDKGEKPRGPSASGDHLRTEQGAVIYSHNVLGFKGPRKMRVIIPSLKDDDSQILWRPRSDREGLLHQYNSKGPVKGMYVMHNKSPVWNDKTKSYVLNFHSRVRQPSVKNFQLVGSEDEEILLMQFGRVSGGVFTMDFRWPLSLFQAFGVALTSFDSKLACE